MDFERFEEIPDDTYEIVYADPPWLYYGDPNKDAAAGKHYIQMDDEALAKLPVRKKMKKRSVLFMWGTCPRLDAAIDLFRAWDLYFRGVSFIWTKTRRDGGIIGAQGPRPSIVKPTAELVLVGSPMRKGRPLPVLDEKVAQSVLAPRRKHSEKPEEVRRRIDRLYGPHHRRIELFARGAPVRFWDRFGNQMDPETPSALDLVNEKTS